jgi:hypothetical protein
MSRRLPLLSAVPRPVPLAQPNQVKRLSWTGCHLLGLTVVALTSQDSPGAKSVSPSCLIPLESPWPQLSFLSLLARSQLVCLNSPLMRALWLPLDQPGVPPPTSFLPRFWRNWPR